MLVDTLRQLDYVKVVEWNKSSAACYVIDSSRIMQVIHAVEKATGDVFVKRVSPSKDFGDQCECINVSGISNPFIFCLLKYRDFKSLYGVCGRLSFDHVSFSVTSQFSDFKAYKGWLGLF